MLKPDSLRAYLQAGHPFLKKDPDRLLVRVEDGSAVGAYGAGLNFEWRYTVKLTLLDFSGDRAVLFALIFAWIGRHQRELLQNRDLAEKAVTFQADILDSTTADLEISIPLTEGVIASQGEGGFELTPRPEHPEELDLPTPSLLHELYANAELLVACQAHHPAETP